MRTRIQAKRQKSASKEPQKPWAKLQPRPFGAASEANADTTAAPLNQAQIDRVAHAPNFAAMPLYSPESIASSSGMGSAVLQTQENAESNLKSPEGTLQRQAEDQQVREEALHLQRAPDEEELQMQLEDKERKAVQEKAEVGAEVEKDEAVQTELETEEEETLQRQVEAEEAEEDLMQTEQDLAIAQDQKKTK